ncbi:MAG TPA: hypothetical protein VFP61_13410 [Acidimicrobiales bacterium]|nr:hypothetical protein [Acidimicrobiales bacterium]
MQPLSDLSAPLALRYLERIARTAPALTPQTGALLTSLGHAAHRAVEADGSPWGVTEVPVLSLPDRPPGDLLLRLVKESRRPFPALRAVDAPTWEGFVDAVTAREGTTVGRPMVDGLVRLGWLLRQVDLRYGDSAAELGD